MKNFPFPPSDNRKFLSRKFIKTPEWRGFENEVELWKLANRRHLAEGKKFIAEATSNRLQIAITLLFIKSKLITKDGRDKRVDAANRLKSLLDSIAKTYDFDDSRFFHVSVEKKVGEAEENRVVFFIQSWQESASE